MESSNPNHRLPPRHGGGLPEYAQPLGHAVSGTYGCCVHQGIQQMKSIDKELNENLGDSPEYHYWLEASKLTPDDIEELAARFDADERHSLKRKANPHDD